MTVAMAVAAALSATSPARAQTASTAANDAPTAEVVVTGSRVLRTDVETPSPVQIISHEDLENIMSNNARKILFAGSDEASDHISTLAVA